MPLEEASLPRLKAEQRNKEKSCRDAKEQGYNNLPGQLLIEAAWFRMDTCP